MCGGVVMMDGELTWRIVFLFVMMVWVMGNGALLGHFIVVKENHF